MPLDEQAQERFLKALALTDFAQQYYRLYESFRDREDFTNKPVVNIKQVADELGISLKYEKREDLYIYQEKKSSLRFTARPYIDFVLSYYALRGIIGGPFTLLAYESALLKDSTFTYIPLAPKISFTSAEDLRKILKQGFALFDIAKQAASRVDTE